MCPLQLSLRRGQMKQLRGNPIDRPPTRPYRPPSRRMLVAVWLSMLAMFGALLFAANASKSGLDDPDPALQRPGFLDAGGLPQPARAITSAVPRKGRRAVVFFVRPGTVGSLCRALGKDQIMERADVVVVVSGPGLCRRFATVNDRQTKLARDYRMRRPRAGGPPVGYAIVDSSRQIRYRTLDPGAAARLPEVDTILRATS